MRLSVTSAGEPIAGYAGVATCGRVWSCPVCNAKIMARRADEVRAVLEWARAAGYKVLWGAVTLRHERGDELAELLRIQTVAWRSVVQSKFWSKSGVVDAFPHECTAACQLTCERVNDYRLSEREGRVGYIRAAELTHGGNGWHPHFHPIILYRGTDAAASAYAASVEALWIERVKRAGGVAASAGNRVRLLTGDDWDSTLSRYVTKAVFDLDSIAMEATWSQGKAGHSRAGKTQSHWSLLTSAGNGNKRAGHMWRELERATAGRRMITWSRGIRRFAGLLDEVPDEEVAAEELGTVEDTIAVFSRDSWGRIRDEPYRLCGMLEAAEAGRFGLYAAKHGVEWYDLDRASGVHVNDAGDTFEGAGPTVNRTDWAAHPARKRGAVFIEPELVEAVILRRHGSSSFDDRTDDDFWFAYAYDAPPPGLRAAS
jgi:hypothetical protein